MSGIWWVADVVITPDKGQAHLAMRLSILTLAVLGPSLTGCDRQQPIISREALARISAADPSMSEACLNLIKFGGVEAMPLEVDRCYPMTPARRWHGLWHDAFEGQRFCPAPSRDCSYDTAGEEIWIEFKPGTRPLKGGPTGHMFSISFIGRRTLAAGHHGHLGMSPYAIVVDKLISISPAKASSPIL